MGIAFGFRNLTYKNERRERHLSEISRVTANGGRFVIVESSQPRSRLVRAGFHAFLRSWVRYLGGMLSGERIAYRYLATSAERFYEPAQVEQMLLEAGFISVRTVSMLSGAAALHVAQK